jgi:hypothetical protein
MTADDAPTRYVTLAYGRTPEIYRQSVMLLVSLVAHAPQPYEIVVATDRPECYAWFGTRVEIEYVDTAVLEGWSGPRPFSMRQKIVLLRTAWPARGAIVLLDADVLARADLSSFVRQLQAGRRFLHRREFTLSRSRRPGNRRLWRSIRHLDLGPCTPTAEDAMWNSGVIALPAGDRQLVEDTLRLYDDLAARGVRHFATEQLVESLVMSRAGSLSAAEPWFTHYWGNKRGYDAEISQRLANAFIEGMSVAEAATRYRERPIDLPAEVRPSNTQKIRQWLEKSRIPNP